MNSLVNQSTVLSGGWNINKSFHNAPRKCVIKNNKKLVTMCTWNIQQDKEEFSKKYNNTNYAFVSYQLFENDKGLMRYEINSLKREVRLLRKLVLHSKNMEWNQQADED